jgi:hypothetical protein
MVFLWLLTLLHFCSQYYHFSLPTMMKTHQNQSPSSFRKRWAALNWWLPVKGPPHGVTGALSVALGLRIISNSVTGQVYQYDNDVRRQSISFNVTNYSLGSDGENGFYDTSMDLQMNLSTQQDIPWTVLAFAFMSVANAIGGYRLLRSAPKHTRPIFASAAVFQISLAYFCVRFLPHFTVMWRYLEANQTLVGLPSLALGRALWIMDSAMTLLALYASITLVFQGVCVMWVKSKATAIGIACGGVGILLCSVYPVQLVVRGQDWFECVQDRYSFQAAAMVGYIYVPLTVTFSLILFGATLMLRGILSYTQFGISTLLVVVLCLFGTVLSQEVHFPDVSTQRIYLPCHEPEMGSLEKSLVDALDFSMYARRVLSSLFGMEFVTSRQ